MPARGRRGSPYQLPLLSTGVAAVFALRRLGRRDEQRIIGRMAEIVLRLFAELAVGAGNDAVHRGHFDAVTHEAKKSWSRPTA